MADSITITIPSRSSGAIIGDLPEFARAIASFSALIDAVDLTYPKRVPRSLVRALDQMREDLIAVGELHLAVAVVRVT